jgi:hypothetical protein
MSPACLNAMELVEGLSLAAQTEAESNSLPLPEPALFFTWYCEKAREIERQTGSVDQSLQFLDAALKRVSGARLAKRFMNATRSSLLRYRAHLTNLAAKLEDTQTGPDEKVAILQALKTMDLREFERKSKPLPAQHLTSVPHFEAPMNVASKEIEPFRDSEPDFDLSSELDVIELILQNKLQEAYDTARRQFFFPSLLSQPSSQTGWLYDFCTAMEHELSARANGFSTVAFRDNWFQFVEKRLPRAVALPASSLPLVKVLAARQLLESILSASAATPDKLQSYQPPPVTSPNFIDEDEFF